LAFYAGMMECFIMVALIADTVADDDAGLDAGSDQLEAFSREIALAATVANLDRSDGKS
jgi:hypothetical protein